MRLLIAAALAVSLLAPPLASADMADCPRKLERQYTRQYHKVAKMHGTRAPGRNIRRYGVLWRSRYRGKMIKTVFDATCGEIRRSKRQLVKLTRSAPYPTLIRTAGPPPQPPANVETAGVTGVYNGWAIPESIVMCESGGTNQPPNSASASGYYQIIYSTWHAYGGTTEHAYLASKAEQDRVAAAIWAGGAGRSQWDC